MPFFIDTSALFKRYQPEQGTDLVCRILEDANEIAKAEGLLILNPEDSDK